MPLKSNAGAYFANAWHGIRSMQWRRISMIAVRLAAGVGVILASSSLNHWEPLLGPRYAVYHALNGHGGPRQASHVALVMLTDDDYYETCPYKVRPMGDHLAAILTAIADHRPAVIALDILPRSIDAASEARLDRLANKVKELSLRNANTIVLSEVISAREGGSNEYVRTPTDFDDRIWNVPGRAQLYPSLRAGYFNLEQDIRQIPWTKVVTDGSTGEQIQLASFAVATAWAAKPNSLMVRDQYQGLPYARFWQPDGIPTVTGKEVLSAAPDVWQRVQDALHGQVVLVGAEWHEDGCRLGALADRLEQTPLGPQQGVYLHATYVESILSQEHLYRPVPYWVVKGMECAIAGVLSLVLLFLRISPLRNRSVLLFAAGTTAVLFCLVATSFVL